MAARAGRVPHGDELQRVATHSHRCGLWPLRGGVVAARAGRAPPGDDRFPGKLMGEDVALVRNILDTWGDVTKESNCLPRLKGDLERVRAEHGEDAVPQRAEGASQIEYSLAQRFAHVRARFPGDLTREDLALAPNILDAWGERRIGAVMQEREKSSKVTSFRARVIYVRAKVRGRRRATEAAAETDRRAIAAMLRETLEIANLCEFPLKHFTRGS